MVCGALSQIFIKQLVDRIELTQPSLASLAQFFRPEIFIPGSIGAASLLGGFLLWLACLTRLDLSYAYPIACSSVLLVTLFSTAFLGEPVTLRIWVGTLSILFGILLLLPGDLNLE